MEQILLIDDDLELADLLSDYLAEEGFQITAEKDGAKGLERALNEEYVLVILDIMLPSLNGLEVLKNIRLSSDIPVIMLTARGDEVDRIVGLEMGADDYLPKPFNPRELVARLRAVRRRSNENTRNSSTTRPRHSQIHIDDLILDPETRMVSCKGEAAPVTGAEFSLLYELLQQAGKVVSRDALIKDVLGRKPSVFDRSIDVHIASLRKKLGHEIDGRQRIITIRGVGYMYTLGENSTP